MEPQRFDELAASVAEGETSRRSVVMRLGGGGLAALLVALRIGGDAEDAEAKKRRRRRRRRRRRPATQSPSPSFEINNSIDLGLLGGVCTVAGGECGQGTGLGCVGLICLPVGEDDGVACADGSDCDSGRCTAGFCAPCPLVAICEENTVCCVIEADCIADVCVLPDDN